MCTHALKVRCPLWAGDIACSGILVFWQQMASKMSNPSRWYGSFVTFLRPDASAHRKKELRRESGNACAGDVHAGGSARWACTPPLWETSRRESLAARCGLLVLMLTRPHMLNHAHRSIDSGMPKEQTTPM